MGKHDKDYDTTVARAAGNILAGAGLSLTALHEAGNTNNIPAYIQKAIEGAVRIAKQITDEVREIAPMSKG